MGAEFPFGEDEKVLEMSGGDGRTTTQRHLAPPNRRRNKWLKWYILR